MRIRKCTWEHRPEEAGENLHMHVEAGPEAHMPDGAGRDPSRHVRAGPRPTSPRDPVETRTCTWKPVRWSTGARGPVGTLTYTC